jgi:hypothetical protein
VRKGKYRNGGEERKEEKAGKRGTGKGLKDRKEEESRKGEERQKIWERLKKGWKRRKTETVGSQEREYG